MPMTLTEDKPFIPGTLGWTADDLDDPQIEALWEQGSYEIVDGVLTTMPAAYFAGGETLASLIHVIKSYQDRGGLPGRFSVEVDLILARDRVAKGDSVFLTRDDSARQKAAAKKARRKDLRRTRILIAPALVIEVISPGHERHDEATKRRWYAEAGIPHYWIVDCFRQMFTCLVLRDGKYDTEVAITGLGTLTPSLFPGLTLDLAEVWPADDDEMRGDE